MTTQFSDASQKRPRLLITMGDVAGVGPEIIAKAWPQLTAVGTCTVVGDPGWLRRANEVTGGTTEVITVDGPSTGASSSHHIPCLRATNQSLDTVQPGQVHAAAGRAAYDFLCAAIDLTKAGVADAIVTAPLHKEGLRAAGLPHPGHTEILAERTGTSSFGMVLYADKLAVVHATLHMALRDVFAHLATRNVLEKIRLLDCLLPRLLNRRPRIGVAALNPHAGDGGLFGDEETTVISPAVGQAQREGIEVSGPWPSDAIFVRARDGEFDGIVAMYHDQGHIALKLMAGRRAVNISAGLPIIRTSVAHGTAYDIAGTGTADPSSLVAAAEVAARLASCQSTAC
jgi:4-hydroxythreonine-4-phosphate dehydrogenase